MTVSAVVATPAKEGLVMIPLVDVARIAGVARVAIAVTPSAAPGRP
jgi:hypothetical protein